MNGVMQCKTPTTTFSILLLLLLLLLSGEDDAVNIGRETWSDGKGRLRIAPRNSSVRRLG